MITTLVLKSGIMLLVLGFMIHVVAFSVPHWYSDRLYGTSVYGGLWLLCVEDKGCDATPDGIGGLFHFVQAMEAIALILGILALGSLSWVLRSNSTPSVRLILSLTAAAGVISLCGAVTFISGFSEKKEWGAYIEPFAGISFLLSAVCFWLEKKSLIDTYDPIGPRV